MHWQARAVHIQAPIIQTYEGPQGPGTMLLKSGTVPGTVEAYVYITLQKKTNSNAQSPDLSMGVLVM